MLNLIRIAAVTGRVDPGSPAGCRKYLAEELKKAAAHAPDVLLLPSDILLPPSAQSLRQQGYLLELCQQELAQLAEELRELPSLLFVGLPVSLGGVTVSAMAAVRQGAVLGYVLPPSVPEGPLPEGFLPASATFEAGGARLRVLPGCDAGEALRYSALARDCDCLLLPCYQPTRVGSADRAEQALSVLSRELGCAAVLCCGAGSDSSHPFCYRGLAVIAEAGETVSVQAEFGQSATLCYDIDLDIVRRVRTTPAGFAPAAFRFPAVPHDYALRSFSSTPYLPMEPEAERRTLREWFELQSHSLAARLSNTGIDRAVVGISGGLDSTLALLVCHRAAQLMRLSPEHILAVTMPGFGTSERTHQNALDLPRKLGMSTLDISIVPAVKQHLADIGHPLDRHDITYENAQARERTQILLDLGNQIGGIVVGTGDLTEEALGWCTFGGDALAGYNVNVTVPKTAIRRIVAMLAEESSDAALSAILRDILDTPISPELLPLDESGSISQKTEEILGDYEVHDFYLYYFVKYGFSPRKLLFYAQNAFDDRYTEEQLRNWLSTFLRRFVGGQFKRSVAPEAASITDFGLSALEFSVPSDMSARTLLRELDR